MSNTICYRGNSLQNARTDMCLHINYVFTDRIHGQTNKLSGGLPKQRCS